MDHSTIAMLGFGAALATLVPWQLHLLIAQRQRRTALAIGRVVDVACVDTRRDTDEGDLSVFQAMVAFDASGQTHRFRSAQGCGGTWPCVGGTLAIRYDPRDPANAAVDTEQNLTPARLLQVGTAIFGVALVAGALLTGS
jgi:hypothetical protein